MWRYIILRAMTAIPVIAVVGVITFSLIHVAPGDPASVILGNDATPESLRELREYMGLDQPPAHPVRELGWEARPGGSRHLGLLQAVDMGGGEAADPTDDVPGNPDGYHQLAARHIAGGWSRPGRPAVRSNQILRLISVIGFSLPGFYLAFLLIWGFAVNLGWFGVTWLHQDSGRRVGALPQPALRWPSSSTASWAPRSFRGSPARPCWKSFGRTIFGRPAPKGWPSSASTSKHAFRNASIPVVTIIGGDGPTALVTGFVVTESVFAIPGTFQDAA